MKMDEYIMQKARRFGLSLIEALNDWDMLTEETRKQFR
jgi:hypothetical protein